LHARISKTTPGKDQALSIFQQGAEQAVTEEKIGYRARMKTAGGRKVLQPAPSEKKTHSLCLIGKTV